MSYSLSGGSNGEAFDTPNSDELGVSEVDSDKIFTAEELNALTVKKIKALAQERGYSIKETAKSDIIEEFISQQNQ